jgi:hypothetical protein
MSYHTTDIKPNINFNRLQRKEAVPITLFVKNINKYSGGKTNE